MASVELPGSHHLAGLLITVAVESNVQSLDLDAVDDAGPTEVSLLFVGLPRRQVAGTGVAMLHLAAGRQTEAFLRPLVRFHLGHDRLPALFLGSIRTRPVIINTSVQSRKGDLRSNAKS